MGNCNSSDSTQVATAKLVLQDGRLQEFSYPVKVSFLLQKYPACFICNSDEMDFHDVVSAVHEDHVLQPGHLYFALPLSRLTHPLQPHEMAALAVKASSALMKTAHKCGSRRKQILLSTEYHPTSKRLSPALSLAHATLHRRGRTSAAKGRFAALLSSIPE
ncbi:uncharacterized protein LOC109801308 [Cajanus cajan]|uniref:Uncharacterized protein n=1 Tax=Cajanus cajan TaxID=3821 RepID=A0A151TI07_CAJCA|nr:uncharacterized protein LOC109801308 [Cajanus cajan]KYP66695.1 hypothetical protein KK1_013001 [Cajanus cajan]